MLLLKAVKYVLGWGLFLGLLVALVAATISLGIDKLFALSLPAFTAVARWSYAIWLGLVILDATKTHIQNFFASRNLAQKWGVSQHEVIDAIVNHNLARESHFRWEKKDFLQWYSISRTVARINITV